MQLAMRKERGKISVAKLDETGRVIAQVSRAFKADTDYKKSASALNVPIEILLRYLLEFDKGGKDEQLFTIDYYGLHTLTVNVRAINDSSENATGFLSFEEAVQADLPNVSGEYVLESSSSDLLAFIDLDRKDSSPVAYTTLVELMATFTPTPCYAWITHGGGIRLVYKPYDRLSAKELAALAYFQLSMSFQYSDLEIKTITRHPKCVINGRRCSEVIAAQPNIDQTGLNKYLHSYTVTDAEVVEWLNERGMQVNKRYPHTMCPVNPSNQGKRNPVLVGRYGIKCFVCESSGDGFFSYSRFLGHKQGTVLYKCLKSYTHYDHVRYILSSQYNMAGDVGKTFYRALLKLYNDDERRTQDCFRRGSNMIRLGSSWTTSNGKEYTKDLKALLMSLPVCRYTTSDGKYGVDPEMVAKLQQPHDLTSYGYPSLTPIFGCRIGTHYLDSNNIYATIQNSNLDANPEYQPKVCPVASTKDALADIVPNYNRNFIKLLIAARGCVELGNGLPPFIFVSGPTGAGKSTSIKLAAGVIGDRCTSVVWSPEINRVREAILINKMSGSFIVFNEMMKHSKKSSPRDALDFLLDLTPDSVSHKLYVGPTELGVLPVICFTDTHLPMDIKQDKQLARRILNVHLANEVNWEQSLIKAGVSNIELIRLQSKAVAASCDQLISEVVEEFFTEPHSFMDIATALGFTRLTEREEYADADDVLQQFFNAVCKAPALNGADSVRWKGKGWKLITPEDTSDISKLWGALADGEYGHYFTMSRRCSEVDWQKVCRLDTSTVFEIKHHGTTRIVVRFKEATDKRQGYKVNEELR